MNRMCWTIFESSPRSTHEPTLSQLAEVPALVFLFLLFTGAAFLEGVSSPLIIKVDKTVSFTIKDSKSSELGLLSNSLSD